MKELVSVDNGLEFAVEKTRQHFWELHSDIRLEFNRVQDEANRITVLLVHHDVGAVATEAAPEPEKPKAPPSKEIKEIYRRICNLCHPDKVGHSDEILLEFMRDARLFYKERSDTIFVTYENLKLYIDNPELYRKVKQMAFEEQTIKRSPWYSIYNSFNSGDMYSAFIQSRKIFGMRLAEEKSKLARLRIQAKEKGFNV